MYNLNTFIIMSVENKVSVQIPAKTLTDVKAKVKEIQTLLKPYLIAMTPEERGAALKMGDATEPFVQKVIDYAKTDPQFLPPYFNVDDIEVDFNATRDLNSVARPLEQIMNGLSDTILLSGSEAFQATLSFYNSVGYASKAKVPGAKSIHDNLKSRFNGQGKKK